MKNKDTHYFLLFASCFPVKGASECLIYDTQRLALYPIPNDHFDVLMEMKGKSMEQLKREYPYDFDSLEGFINQLISLELGFITTEPDRFPPIDLVWKSPFELINATLQVTPESDYNMERVVADLLELDCQDFQLQFEGDFRDDVIENYLELFKDSRAKYIELILAFNNKRTIGKLQKWIHHFPRLRLIKLYGAVTDELFESDDMTIKNKIFFFKKDIRTDPSEIIAEERFQKQLHFFTESQNHNPGLNRKVAISKQGEIKNYLSHKTSFGNVLTDKIATVIRSEKFQKKWFLANDKIEKCRDCQYRYGCLSTTDVLVEKGTNYKAETCNFDPYINQWK